MLKSMITFKIFYFKKSYVAEFADERGAAADYAVCAATEMGAYADCLTVDDDVARGKLPHFQIHRLP